MFLFFFNLSLDAMTFNGNSYIRYSLADKKAKLNSFSVSVKTTKPSGTILSAKGKNDYFIIEVSVFICHFTMFLNSQENVCLIVTNTVTCGKRHSFSAYIYIDSLAKISAPLSSSLFEAWR